MFWRPLLGVAGATLLAAAADAPVVAPTVAPLQGTGPSLGHTPGFLPTVAWALGPLLAMAVVGMSAFRRAARPFEWSLLFWGLALVTGAMLLVPPGNNQYKFVHLASQPLGLLADWALRMWSEGARRPRVRNHQGTVL
jgi:hypothetical protein